MEKPILKLPMVSRSKMGFIAGLALFVVGVGTAAYLGTRPDAAPSAAAARVQVFATAAPVDTGTPGPAALAQGLLKPRMVAAATVPVNAVTDPLQIAGGVAAAVIPAGTIITSDMFPDPQTRIGTVVIPPGKRALALKLEPVPGVAGFVGAGDLIDVYGVTVGGDVEASRVKLVLQSVEVLNVNGTGLPAAQGVAEGPSLVYLLAVTPSDAEKLIFISEFNKLYFDLVAKGEPPVVTPGAGAEEALQGV
jgi:pilus assembly protein CpaB